MIFSSRIEGKQHKRILEIGPGGLPHPASDVWLDYDFDEAERVRQSGGVLRDRGCFKGQTYSKFRHKRRIWRFSF